MARRWERADEGDLLGAVLGGAARRLAGRPLADLLEADVRALAEAGLDATSRARLMAVAEIARRHQPASLPPPAVTAPRDALQHLGPLRLRPKEALCVLLLDSRMCVIGLAPVAEGSLAHVAATPREVFAPALAAGASALLMAHNHPSGQVEPSAEDLEFTRSMVQAGRLLEVPVVDHLVVARRGYFSLREAGLM